MAARQFMKIARRAEADLYIAATSNNARGRTAMITYGDLIPAYNPA